MAAEFRDASNDARALLNRKAPNVSVTMHNIEAGQGTLRNPIGPGYIP